MSSAIWLSGNFKIFTWFLQVYLNTKVSTQVRRCSICPTEKVIYWYGAPLVATFIQPPTSGLSESRGPLSSSDPPSLVDTLWSLSSPTSSPDSSIQSNSSSISQENSYSDSDLEPNSYFDEGGPKQTGSLGNLVSYFRRSVAS